MRARRGLSVLAGAGLVLGSLAFAAPANAAPTRLYVVNAFSYAANQPFDFTVCLDDEPIASLSTTELNGPVDGESGDFELEVFDGLDRDCTDLDPELVQTVTIPDSPTTTIMLYWGDDPQVAEAVSVFADDLTCTEPGTSRLLVRNGAQTYDAGLEPLNATATDPGGQAVSLAAALPLGEEQASVQDPGTYTDLEVTPQFDPEPFADVTLEEGVVTALYFYGGNDGAVGSFTHTSEVGVCEEPTTTTTAAPTTTTAAQTAAVATTPRYTG